MSMQLVAGLLLLLVQNARGFTVGAPVAACTTLTPSHNNYVTQPLSTSPYNVTVSASELYQGEHLQVTISGKDFKGFILQARQPGSIQAIGRFMTEDFVKFTCGQGLFNTATHNRYKDPAASVTLDWMAPEEVEGDILFMSCVVKQHDTFWTGLESPKVKIVKRSVPLSEPPTTVTTTAGALPSTTTTTTTTTVATPTAASASTTTSTIVTTPPLVTTTEPPHAKVYDGCLKEKGCFGYPKNCVNTNSCALLVTYHKSDQGNFIFELMGKSDGYISVGFSKDNKMGDDAVVECVNQDGIIQAYKSYNEEAHNKRLEQDQQQGFSQVKGSVVDGLITCSFALEAIFTARDRTFNINDDKYILFIAAGYTRKDNIGFHTFGKAWTSEPTALSRIEEVVPDSELFVRLHGSLMLGAWIGTASCGMLLARYYKQTWMGKKLFKKDLWFVWHRNFMILTWLLTNAGFILIFLEIKQWMKGKYKHHGILGCVTTGLCFIQPFMAMLRPHPSDSFRPVFNWIHWLIGNSAQIVAIVTIFYAIDLGKAKLPQYTDWILVAFVGFYGLMHLILSIQQCASDKSARKHKEVFMMRDMNVSKAHRPYLEEDANTDAPKSGCRKFALGVYMLVTILFAAVLILMVVFAPIEDTLKQWIDWP